MIADSRDSIWIKAADDVVRRHKRALKAAAERGVGILMVLFGFDAEEFRFTERCRIYIHEANGVRLCTAANLFTLAIEQVAMLKADKDSDLISAYNRNSPSVKMAELRVAHHRNHASNSH